jgi:hypothetical protein
MRGKGVTIIDVSFRWGRHCSNPTKNRKDHIFKKILLAAFYDISLNCVDTVVLESVWKLYLFMIGSLKRSVLYSCRKLITGLQQQGQQCGGAIFSPRDNKERWMIDPAWINLNKAEKSNIFCEELFVYCKL